MKKKLHEESFIVQNMRKEFEKNPNFNYQLFHSCKKICDSYGIEQLNHAKAVLQQSKTYRELYVSLMSFGISLAAILVNILSILIQSQFDIDSGISIFTLFGVAVMAYYTVLLRMGDDRRDEYFISVIEDEVLKRSK